MIAVGGGLGMRLSQAISHQDYDHFQVCGNVYAHVANCIQNYETDATKRLLELSFIPKEQG